MYIFQCGRFQLDLSRPQVMAIVNLTQNSFSGDGLGTDGNAILRRAEQALTEGADILDLGAESTRPGAASVDEALEIEHIVRAVEQLRPLNVPLSIDTLKPAVMRAALDAGADMINDVNGFRTPGAIEAIRAGTSGLCIMHMQGEPRTMQDAPEYDNVTEEVRSFLNEQVQTLLHAGIAANRITIDPGFGFGKTVDHNFTLLNDLPALQTLGLPILVGLSRKSMLGAVTGREVSGRMPASIAAALLAVERGAAIVRVHDVAPTVDALKVKQALSPSFRNHSFNLTLKRERNGA